MKKLKFILGAFLLTFIMGVGIDTVSADTNIIVGKEYKINLDEKGKKEKLYVKEIITDEDSAFSTYELYINDKMVKKVTGSTGFKCKVMDIKHNKKGKEIVFSGKWFSNTTVKFGIYKYKSKTGKLKKIGGERYGYYYIYRMPEITTNGKGRVYLTTDTPIDLNTGCYFGKVVLELKNGKLQLVNDNQIKMADSSRKYKYELTENANVYKKAAKKSKVVRKLKAGDKVKILKLKYKNVKVLEADYLAEAGSVFAYVKDSNGNKGWIKIKKYKSEGNDNQFVEYPAWG